MHEVSITTDGETETLKLRCFDKDDALCFLIEGYDPFISYYPFDEAWIEQRAA
jgi:hypothetical protein